MAKFRAFRPFMSPRTPFNPMTGQYAPLVPAVSTGVGATAAFARVVDTSGGVQTGLRTIDGITCVAGDFVLIAGAYAASSNGLWKVDSDAWTRVSPNPIMVYVREGTLHAETSYGLQVGKATSSSTTSIQYKSAGAHYK